MSEKMEIGTKIALLIVVFGMLLVGYSAVQINEGAESEPDDARSHLDVKEYGENGTLESSQDSVFVEDSQDAWSRPLMSTYAWILFLGILLIIIFGIAAVATEVY